MLHIVALSGGKDSTAMALRLKEVEPSDYTYICTPTGDELPEMEQHWSNLELLLGQEIIRLVNPEYPTLKALIEHMRCLPNFHMRFCTRVLKIEVAQEFYIINKPSIAYVGLRADEEDRKGGIYGDTVTQRFPLREWGWTIRDVRSYLKRKGVKIPPRTDCARCFHQRIGEWWNLYRYYPEIYANAEIQEIEYGHTFRTVGKDSWPTSLKDLRLEFGKGRTPMKAGQLEMPWIEPVCRACSL